MAQRLIWPRDGHGWPHAGASRLVVCAGQQWFVQQMGRGPTVLLLHGTGGSAHSWRDLLPALAQHFEVLAVDLPGHGFSAMPAASQGLSMHGMAAALGALLTQLQLRPALLVAHSAGAAVALRMAIDSLVQPSAIVSFNGALRPLQGAAGRLFLPIARLMASAPLVPQLFAWRASDRAAVQRLIEGTGSTLDDTGMALYARLVASPGHVQGALGMMARWDLPSLQHDLPALTVPLRLVVGERDRAVPPAQGAQVLARLRAAPRSSLTRWPGLGHLAHEEQPLRAAALVIETAREHGVLR